MNNMSDQITDSDYQISIIMPVYNVETFLEYCLNSVIKSIENICAEIICVDDGSTDGSGEILEKFSAAYSCITVYHIEHGGAGRARNYGVSKATGKYIAFVDSDDVVSETLFSDYLYLAKATNVPMVICNVSRYKNIRTSTVSGQYQRAFMTRPKLITNIEESPSFIYDGSPCNKLILRSFWQEHDFSFPEGRTYEDMPVFLKLFCDVNEFAVLHSFGYYWRIRPDGDSVSQDLGSVAAVDQRIISCSEMLNYLVEKYGANSPMEKYMERRLVCWEFDNFLLNIHNINKNQREEFISRIAVFLRKHISEEVLAEIPDFHRRKHEFIVNLRIDDLIRLMNHKRIAWRNAPIVVKDSKHFIKLPSSIYGREYSDASIELQEDLPLTNIIDFECEDSSINIHAIVYQPRVNIEHEDSQEIKAYIYNEHTGNTFTVACEAEKTTFWTEEHGELLCNDDYRIYNYNYDWAGVKLSFDIKSAFCSDPVINEIFAGKEKVKPRWLLVIEYRTPVLKGHRILRGISVKAKQAMDDATIEFTVNGVGYESRFIQDRRGTFMIELRD